MNIFISWSGQLSKHVASHLKSYLIKLFEQEKPKVFMSDETIQPGEEWYKSIEKNILRADLCIIVLTKENLDSRWINFEAGAIAIRRKVVPVVPFLADLSKAELGSPLNQRQCIQLEETNSFYKLAEEVCRVGKFKIPTRRLKALVSAIAPTFFEKTIDERKRINNDYLEADVSVYPSEIKKIKKGQVFLGAPMAGLPKGEYSETRKGILKIKNALENVKGVSSVYFPGEKIESPNKFHTKAKALQDDMKKLKESEYFIFIYMNKVVSGVLLEMGYGIALSKKTLIFVRKRADLPFMLEEADRNVPFLHIVSKRSANSILKYIRENEFGAFVDLT